FRSPFYKGSHQNLRKERQYLVSALACSVHSYARGYGHHIKILLAAAGPSQSHPPLYGSSYFPSLRGQRFFPATGCCCCSSSGFLIIHIPLLVVSSWRCCRLAWKVAGLERFVCWCC